MIERTLNICIYIWMLKLPNGLTSFLLRTNRTCCFFKIIINLSFNSVNTYLTLRDQNNILESSNFNRISNMELIDLAV